ncbi:hypothetical protein INT45_006513 [Circinella minor]|uniref:Uncharacterized protein n=1 Tax=Circinella minor TaxID=1195481 RepID=A0A8H7S2G0_9FUNG|nr:hypothetical protein INT45_006513 [Circinella minor]
MVDKELQRLKTLAVVSGLNKAFTQEPSPISNNGSTNGLPPFPPPSSSSVSSITSSSMPPPRPSTVCLNDLRQPQQTQSTIVSTNLSQRSSGSSLHFDYMQYKKQMKRRSSTLPIQQIQQVQQVQQVQQQQQTQQQKRTKTITLDDLEKDLLGMFEEVYLRCNHHGGVAPSVATQEVDADRIDNWMVNVAVSTHPNPDHHHDNDSGETRENPTIITTTPPKEMDDIEEEEKENKNRVKELEATVKKLNEAQKQHIQWEQNIQKVVTHYMEQKEVETAKTRQLSQVVIKQERLIEEMQNHLDQVIAANANLRSCFQETSWGPIVAEARDELKNIHSEISALAETKYGLEETISNLQIELKDSQQQIQHSLNTTHQLESECQIQRSNIDEKLESLKKQVLEKDTLLQKYRTYGPISSPNDQRKVVENLIIKTPLPSNEISPSPMASPTTTTNHSKRGSIVDTRRLSYSSIASNHTTGIPKPPVHGTQSRRGSTNTTSSSKRSYIARWTGGPLPPAAPPPTDPLPPLPSTEMNKQRGVSNDTSSLSHLDSPTSLLSLSSLVNSNHKIIHRSSMDSSSEIISVDEEEAYREFTEQLQTRLSVSKEIDELQVWQPTDLEELQKRIDAKWGDLQEDQDDPHKRHSLATLASKDGAAFWRGMKKKLRV